MEFFKDFFKIVHFIEKLRFLLNEFFVKFIPDPGCLDPKRFFPDPNLEKSFGSDRIRIHNVMNLTRHLSSIPAGQQIRRPPQ